jgi:hypothetical protein
MTLFIAIDENLTGGSYEVVFTVHKDRYDEANTLVPLLCLILEEKYGKKIWEWFTDDAKRVVTKYRWDKDVNKVVLIDPDDEGDGLDLDSDDEYTKAICDMMNINEEITGDGFEFDISFIVQEVVTPVNQYGDTGSVKTFRHAFDEDVTRTRVRTHLLWNQLERAPFLLLRKTPSQPQSTPRPAF